MIRRIGETGFFSLPITITSVYPIRAVHLKKYWKSPHDIRRKKRPRLSKPPKKRMAIIYKDSATYKTWNKTVKTSRLVKAGRRDLKEDVLRMCTDMYI